MDTDYQQSMKKIIFGIYLITVSISCKKYVKTDDVTSVPSYANVLILGNSITYSPANPSMGWNSNCGMAATEPDNDYVHLLTARLKAANKSCIVISKNISQFEYFFDTYNYTDSLKTYRDSKPDLIIMRIGEDVTRISDSVLFEKKYVELLNYLKANNPNVKILAVGSVWPERELSNKVMAKYSDYISLISLQNDLTNFSFGLFANSGIENHPSNKGMKSISDQIWTALTKLN